MATRAFVLALLAAGCADHPPLEVAKVELERFQGGWFEIAKLPRATQRGCVATSSYFRLKSPTELDVYNECREGDIEGPLRRIAARAVVPDPNEPAKLSLDFGGFFGDFWIVDIDAEYRVAAIGHPSRDYLWILSRTPTMDDSEYRAVVERARQKGFDVVRLELTTQAKDAEVPAASSLPSPSDHGCTLGGAPSARGSGLAWLAVLAVALGARRRLDSSSLRRRVVTLRD